MSFEKKIDISPNINKKLLIREIRRILLNWGKLHYDNFPWRSTKNSFHALVAEIMLQRTKAEQVKPVFESFVKKYPTLNSANNEDTPKIMALLKPLGLKWRAKIIVDLIQLLKKRNNGIPDNFKGLINLPGVGPYSASAFLTFHANIPASIIDSNSIRLWTRIFGLKNESELRRIKWFKELVDEITPKRHHKEFNYAVLDFTRCICKPRKPLCNFCPMLTLCSYSNNFNSKDSTTVFS